MKRMYLSLRLINKKYYIKQWGITLMLLFTFILGAHSLITTLLK